MQNNTPHLMTVEEFNRAVRSWTNPVKNTMVSNVRTLTRGKGKAKETQVPLTSSIRSRIHSTYGTASRIRFIFAKHGVFLHYGVGRGYIRSGNSLVRGSRNNKPVRMGHAGINRHPVDWFDSTIAAAMNKLADIVQNFCGDEAMNQMLQQFDNAKISKKNGR